MPKLDDLEKAGVFLSADGMLHTSTEKECATCHVTKPIGEFKVTNSHGRRIVGKHCLVCYREMGRVWERNRAANKVCQESTADLTPTTKPEPRKPKPTPDYTGAVFGQAREFNIAWKALLNRADLAIGEERKNDVVLELKKLRALTKRLLNRVGEIR